MLRHGHDQIRSGPHDACGGIEEQRAEQRFRCGIEPEKPRARVLEAVDEALDLSLVGSLGDEARETRAA